MSARFFCYPASQTVPTRVISAHVPMTTARWSLFQQVAAERDEARAALRVVASRAEALESGEVDDAMIAAEQRARSASLALVEEREKRRAVERELSEARSGREYWMLRALAVEQQRRPALDGES